MACLAILPIQLRFHYARSKTPWLAETMLRNTTTFIRVQDIQGHFSDGVSHMISKS